MFLFKKKSRPATQTPKERNLSFLVESLESREMLTGTGGDADDQTDDSGGGSSGTDGGEYDGG